MKPRIEGTDAAVEAPSSRRVNAITGMLTVNAVISTATPPKAGPSSITRR
jgi:hypothetical protein